MRWFGYLLRRAEDTEVCRELTMEVTGRRGKERPARQWKDVIENIKRARGLEKGMVSDVETWRRQIHGSANPS